MPPVDTAELLREIEELRLDRSRWAARALAAGRALAKIRRARQRAVAALPPMPIIIGAPRSGTTLLRLMLDSHPLLAIPPETGFLMQAEHITGEGASARHALVDLITGFPSNAPTWEDFGLSPEELLTALEDVEPFDVPGGLRAFYRLYASRQDKPRYGDKTPAYCEHIDSIRQLLPEARFIHIVRDGRDAALSLRPLWFAPGRDIPTLAAQWRHFVEAARAAAAEDYLEIRYERLLTETETVLREVCGFLRLSFDPAMLLYYQRAPERLKQHVARHNSAGEVVVTQEQRLSQHKLLMEPPRRERIFRWKEEMSPVEQAQFRAVAGDLLDQLGYHDELAHAV